MTRINPFLCSASKCVHSNWHTQSGQVEQHNLHDVLQGTGSDVSAGHWYQQGIIKEMRDSWAPLPVCVCVCV